MKTASRVVPVILLLALAFSAAGLCSDPAWKFVVRIAGVVQCQKAGQGAWVSIWNGRMLSNGDKAKTLKDSRAKILLPDDSFFILGEATTLELSKVEYSQKGRYVQLRLDVGKVRLKVQKFAGKDSRFEVVTPRAVLAARGTEYFVQQDPPAPTGEPGATHWLVFDSAVDVSGAFGRRTYLPGQGGTVDTGNRLLNDSGLPGGSSGGPAGAGARTGQGDESGSTGGDTTRTGAGGDTTRTGAGGDTTRTGTGGDTTRTGTGGTGDSTTRTTDMGTGSGTGIGGGGTRLPLDGDLSAAGTSFGGGTIYRDITGGSTRSGTGTAGTGGSITGATTGNAAAAAGTSTPPYVPATNTTKGGLQIIIR